MAISCHICYKRFINAPVPTATISPGGLAVNRILKLLPLVIVTIATIGCSHNYYNVPQDAYAKKVRVLGIAPLLVDTESDIRHPEKEALVSLLRETNRKNEKELVAMLKDTSAYFSVRLLPDDPDQLVRSLVFRRERRDDAGVAYNKYFFKLQELRDLITRNGVDAVMVVVVSGLAKKEAVRSSNLLSYLDSTYNYLIMTAQILDADGTVLWEYPNFRMRLISFPPMLALQYPAFDEAEANASDQVEVRFKTIAGIGRALGKTQASALQAKTQVSVLYADQFDKMVSLLTPDSNLFGSSKSQEKKPAAPQPQDSPTQTAPASPQQPVEIQPAAQTPAPAAAPATEPVIAPPTPLVVEPPSAGTSPTPPMPPAAIPHSDR
jgi:hypothetical protein